MGIKLMQSDVFDRQVVIVAPDGTKTSLMATFLYLDPEEVDEFTPKKGEVALLERVLKGWKDFRDVEKKAIKYVAANRKDIIKTPYIRAAFLRSFAQGILGLAPGNLGPSPVPGRRHPRKKSKKRATRG